MIWGRCGQNDEVNLLGIDLSVAQGVLAGIKTERGRIFCIACLVALTDTRATLDPFMGSVKVVRQVIVGDHMLRQIFSHPANKTAHTHG